MPLLRPLACTACPPTRLLLLSRLPRLPATRQVGYEALDEITVTRQLVIGGRSKYLINGKVAEPS